jgi:hypothetical protein
MIVNVSVQTLPKKGICDAVATSRSAFATTVVYSRILSAVAGELEGIDESGKVSGGSHSQ